MISSPQLLLAIDTSGPDAGLVLADDFSADVAMLPVDRGFARTEDLCAQAESLFSRRGRRAEELTAVGAVVGPGSYTGLRSGLAFLRGIAFSRAVPAVGVGALELLAWRVGRAGDEVISVWPAGKGRSLVASYSCAPADVLEIARPVTVEDDLVASLITAGKKGSVVACASQAPDAVKAAAREAGFELRTNGGASLTRLAELVQIRIHAGQTTTTSGLLPVYVGLAAIRPAQDLTQVSRDL